MALITDKSIKFKSRSRGSGRYSVIFEGRDIGEVWRVPYSRGRRWTYYGLPVPRTSRMSAARALAVLGISFLQFNLGRIGLAGWNMLIGGLYIIIGILLLRMAPAGHSLGLWSNVVNAVLAIMYAVGWKATAFLFLLPLEIAIVICLVMASKEFGGEKHWEGMAED